MSLLVSSFTHAGGAEQSASHQAGRSDVILHHRFLGPPRTLREESRRALPPVPSAAAAARRGPAGRTDGGRISWSCRVDVSSRTDKFVLDYLTHIRFFKVELHIRKFCIFSRYFNEFCI